MGRAPNFWDFGALVVIKHFSWELNTAFSPITNPVFFRSDLASNPWFVPLSFCHINWPLIEADLGKVALKTCDWPCTLNTKSLWTGHQRRTLKSRHWSSYSGEKHNIHWYIYPQSCFVGIFLTRQNIWNPQNNFNSQYFRSYLTMYTYSYVLTIASSRWFQYFNQLVKATERERCLWIPDDSLSLSLR